MALTGRKQAFADALLAGKSKTQAAIAAGLSEKTAPQAGSRMAKEKDVQAYLAKRGGVPERGRGFTMPNGEKAPDAPPDWPFGTVPAAQPAAAAAPAPAEEVKRKSAEEFLADVINDAEVDIKIRVDAAKKVLEFEKAKPPPMGKKEAKNAAAAAVGGRFARSAPPRLAAAGGKVVS